jgi:hypothetical protein
MLDNRDDLTSKLVCEKRKSMRFVAKQTDDYKVSIGAANGRMPLDE